MVLVENQHCLSSERPNSSRRWFSTLVLASETDEHFEDREAVIADHIVEHATFDTHSIEIDADPDTGYLAIAMEIDGNGEVPVAQQVVSSALEGLRDSNVDLNDLTFRGGRLVCGEELSIDAERGLQPEATDIRYFADDLMGPVFSEHRGQMAA